MIDEKELFNDLYQLYKKESGGKPIFLYEDGRFFQIFLNWLSNKMFEIDSIKSDSKSRIALLCQKAKNKWGMKLQFVVAIEELAELQKELAKKIRNWNLFIMSFEDDESLSSLNEEIADVEIMLYQIKLFTKQFKNISIAKKKKLDRLEERIGEQE